MIRLVHFIMQRRQLIGIARRAEEWDPLLDRFMPDFDIVERHHIRVDVPPNVAFAAAQHVDLKESWLVSAILKLRGLAMGATQAAPARPHGLIAETASMGWRLLVEDSGRELVVGSAAQPWLADVTFKPVDAAQFAAFADPDHVKIAWTLRVDSAHPQGTIFRTETRAIATDPSARAKFLRYWLRVRPGVIAIRWMLLRLLKKRAEGDQLQSLAHGRTH